MKQCPQCHKQYDPADLYFMISPAETCKECEMKNAAEMVEFFMEMGKTKTQALRQLANSKGEAYAQTLNNYSNQG